MNKCLKTHMKSVARTENAELSAARAQGEGGGEEDYCVLTFYLLLKKRVSDRAGELAAHRAYLEGKDLKGRVYISYNGINVKISGPQAVATAYAEWVKRRPDFGEIQYATAPVPLQCPFYPHYYEKMSVFKARKTYAQLDKWEAQVGSSSNKNNNNKDGDIGDGSGYTPRVQVQAKAKAKSVNQCGKANMMAKLSKGISTGSIYEAAEEGVEFCVMNFYHLVDVASEEIELAAHKVYLEGKDIKGRIFISNQGINAQLSGPKAVTTKYAEWIKTRPNFGDLYYSTYASPGHAFPKLTVRSKALVSLLREMDLPVTDPKQRAEKVPPKKWREMLEKGQDTSGEVKEEEKPLLIDVRNDYEWDTGHFAGADKPQEYNFIETPTGREIYSGLEDVDRNKPIMMYCTGGIRCDIDSTVMRKQGFKNLYTLEGGIQKYLREEGDEHWKGSLYVFDSRMAVPTHLDSTKQDGQLKTVAPCAICGETEGQAPHLNCANVDCNKLFLACEKCKPKFKGCCCAECTTAPRLLRPIKKGGGYYAKFHKYREGSEEEGEENEGMGEDIEEVKAVE
jgi:predicted sulfurtransferase